VITSTIEEFISGDSKMSATPFTAMTTNGSNSWCTYINTDGQIPDVDFGGGFLFDTALTDAEIVIVTNVLRQH
jgi:hypothetical protein